MEAMNFDIEDERKISGEALLDSGERVNFSVNFAEPLEGIEKDSVNTFFLAVFNLWIDAGVESVDVKIDRSSL